MPNRRITEFPAILAGDIVDEDILTLVDVFEVDPSLRNKKITFSGFREYLNQYFINVVDNNPFPVLGLLVSGTSTFIGAAQFNNDITVSQSVSITGNLNVSGNIDVDGNVSIDNLSLSSGTISDLTFVSGSGDTITATSGNINNILTTNINTNNITTASGNTDYFSINNVITINSGTAQDLVVNNLSATGLLTITGAVNFTKVIVNAGTNSLPSLTFINDEDTGFFSSESNTLSVTTSGVEHIRINDKGAIGISGTEFGSIGQHLISRGSQAPPVWSSSFSGFTITGGDIFVESGDLLTNNTVSGSNVYASVISGSEIIQAPSGIFPFASGVNANFFTGNFIQVLANTFVGPNVSAGRGTFSTGVETVTIEATTGIFTNTNITTATGVTAIYTTGVFTNLSTTNDFVVGSNLEVSGDITGTIDANVGIFSSGTASQPSITFKDDNNSGFFTDAADELNASTNGVKRITIGSGVYGTLLTVHGNS